MRYRLLQSMPPDGGGVGGPPPAAPQASPPASPQGNPAVPSPPGRVFEAHVPNTQIPAPPDVFFQQARASGVPVPGTPPPQSPSVPAPSNQAADFWGAMGVDGDISQLPAPSPPPSQDPRLYPPGQAPQAPPTPQQFPQQFPSQPVPTPQAPPVALSGQPPIPQANDPFDINRLLEGISVPAPQPQAPQAPQPQAMPQQQNVPAAAPPPAAPSQEELQRAAIEQLMPRYQLSAEDDRGMISEPGRVVPKLAAQLHLSIAQDLAKVVHQMLPGMIREHTRATLGAQRAEMEFFGRYQALNRPEFQPIVAQSLSLVRQMNPQATREEVMQRGAMLAATEIRSRFRPPAAQPQAPVAPYVPPNGGSPAPVSHVQQPANIWEQLAVGEINPW